ncbi:MAG: chorismate synthase [Candidatus Levyibacteriota bacterium]|nr:MAG: chorismate synthase [Candidatus Levybacteria bacterium]
MLKFLTAGESHGKAEIAILEGMPAGLFISHEDINRELKKRMHDYGRGGRAEIETDEAKILSGVRQGKTIGSPIALLVENKDQAKWEDKITKPRPGHADLAGSLKYGFDDVRNVLERASARETVMRVAVGAVCKKFLSEFGIEIASHTIRIGKIAITKTDYSFDEIKDIYIKDPDVHCIDKNTQEKMKQEITNARLNKDTLGGIVEIIAHNVPVGLGSYVHFDKRLDANIAQALMSVPSVKAVEIGNGIEASGKTGKEIQDAITVSNNSIQRKTNNMGGIEGGMSNGEDIVCRVYHKPLSTIYDPLPTVDIKTKEKTVAAIERSDVCVAPRAGVVSESMIAYTLAQAMLEKFGGDSLQETKRNFDAYIKLLPIKRV